MAHTQELAEPSKSAISEVELLDAVRRVIEPDHLPKLNQIGSWRRHIRLSLILLAAAPPVRHGRAKNTDYRQREYLTEAEIDKLVAVAGDSRNPVRDRLLILMAFRHALRVSELVDLRWQQIHLDTATIDIRRAKNGTPGIHGLQGDELRLLRALRREHPDADFVILSERKAPLSVSGAQKMIERFGESAGLPFKIHAHMLRHAARDALAARGIDTRTLQAFMGHRSIANTAIYTAVADKRIRYIWSK
jgi:integrase